MHLGPIEMLRGVYTECSKCAQHDRGVQCCCRCTLVLLVTLSEAKGLTRWTARYFAEFTLSATNVLSMTVGEAQPLPIARIGAIVSPMNPSYREREVAYQLSNSEAVVVVQQELLPLIEAVRAETPTLEHVITVGSGQQVPPTYTHSFSQMVRTQPSTSPAGSGSGWEDVLALPYSSGSTGLPKGVMLSQKNLVVNAYQSAATARITFQDRMLVFVPLYHIYGMPQVYIDLSGWSPKYFPPQLIQYANTLLKHKVLFGSDYPMITPDRWLADFEQIAIKPEVRPLILKENAIKLLGLDTSDSFHSV